MLLDRLDLKWFEGVVSYSYLADGALDEAQYDKRNVVGRKDDDESNSEHRVLTSQVDWFATKSISQ